MMNVGRCCRQRSAVVARLQVGRSNLFDRPYLDMLDDQPKAPNSLKAESHGQPRSLLPSKIPNFLISGDNIPQEVTC